MRSRNTSALAPAVRSGLRTGLALATASVGGSFVLFLLLGYYDPLTQREIITVACCGAGFWGSGLLISTVGKSLTLLRSPTLRWVWDASRFAAFGLTMLLLRGTSALVTLAVLATGFNIFFLILTVVAKRRLAEAFTLAVPGVLQSQQAPAL